MILVAGDHLALDLAGLVGSWLKEKEFEFKNVGASSQKEVLPLVEMVPKVARPIQSNEATSGILICGTGAGVEIGANRFKGIRASLCIEARQAEWARIYDNANVLCLSAWITDRPDSILDAWFGNDFDGDPDRAQMIKGFDEF